MNDFLKRHMQLTREERLLVAAMVLITLIGLVVRWWRSTST